MQFSISCTTAFEVVQVTVFGAKKRTRTEVELKMARGARCRWEIKYEGLKGSLAEASLAEELKIQVPSRQLVS